MSAENVVTISIQNLFYLFLIDYVHQFIHDKDMPIEIINMASEIKATLNILKI